ncbi:MAG TPA: tetratricopeptide repeat protein [Flavisolibacter sp.]
MGKKQRTIAKKTAGRVQPAPGRKRAVTSPGGMMWAFLVAGITAITFIPMLQNGFTNWDDEYYIIQNQLLRGPDWAGIFTTPVVSNYHPFTIITLAINYAISGTDAWSYHLLNLLLHAANTFLVFVFIFRISGKNAVIAAFTALVFGLHPMHVESVSWASERKDVLYTFFFMLSLIRYWTYLERGKSSALAVSLVFFACSLLSKPAAIVLPLVLVLLDYWHSGTVTRRQLLVKLPFFFLSLLFAVITLRLQSETAMVHLDAYPLWERLLIACYTVMTYLLRFFIPYPLSAYHPFPPSGNLGWQVYLAPLFVAALGVVLWLSRKNRPVVFSLLFFLVNIALVVQIISIGFTVVAERYTYVAYIGPAFFLGHLVSRYARVARVRTMAVTAVVLVIFAIISYNRTMTWRDSDTLWTDVISHYPEESLPRADRAQYLYNQAIQMQPAEAVPHFQRIIGDCTVAIRNQEDPAHPDSRKGGTSLYNMRGTSFYLLGDFENAYRDFSSSLAINPYDPNILNYRGTILFNTRKDYKSALADFTRAVEITPHADYLLNRSRCFFMLQQPDAARADALSAREKGAVISPDYLKLLQL